MDRARWTTSGGLVAGGYQVEHDGSIPKVIEIHAHTAIAALHQPIG